MQNTAQVVIIWLMSSIKHTIISSAGDVDFFRLHADFVNDGIVVLRGANIEADQQSVIMCNLGDLVGWFPNKTSTRVFPYDENHKHTIEMRKEKQPDTSLGIDKEHILVAWHYEHLGYPNPAIGASWNMRVFNCSEDCGKTLFIDAGKVFDLLTPDELRFFETCLFSEKVDIPKKYPPILVCPTTRHKTTGRRMVRISPAVDYQSFLNLELVKGRKPTTDERDFFSQIYMRLANSIKNDISLRIEHKWKQFDLAIVDLSRFYHAVTGGFTADERNFYGVWAFERPGDSLGLSL